MSVKIIHKSENDKKTENHKEDKNVEVVMITREIDVRIADACKKLAKGSRPPIPLNYICEEGLKMFLRSKGIEI